GGGLRRRHALPQWGVRALHGLELHRHAAELVMTPAIRQRLLRQPGEDDLERFLVDLGRFQEIHVVVRELVGRDATPDAELEAPAAQLIEHANLLDQAERKIERQDVDERAEPDAPRALL